MRNTKDTVGILFCFLAIFTVNFKDNIIGYSGDTFGYKNAVGYHGKVYISQSCFLFFFFEF